jgi:hypothetical protein
MTLIPSLAHGHITLSNASADSFPTGFLINGEEFFLNVF